MHRIVHKQDIFLTRGAYHLFERVSVSLFTHCLCTSSLHSSVLFVCSRQNLSTGIFRHDPPHVAYDSPEKVWWPLQEFDLLLRLCQMPVCLHHFPRVV